MKKIFIVFSILISTSVFSQANFTVEWESPGGLILRNFVKINQNSNVLSMIFESQSPYNIKIYNGLTHTENYNWTRPDSINEYHYYEAIYGIVIGNTMVTSRDDIQSANFDVNGDGNNEIIFVTNYQYKIIDPTTGNILYSADTDPEKAIDIDDDGYIELIERTSSGTIKIVSTPVLAHPVSVNNQNDIVKNYDLKQNYPNPFNPTTIIEYTLSKNSDVKIIIYDILGKEVNTLVNQKQVSGTYKLNLNGNNLSSGSYFYSLIVDGVSESKKMILIK